jgi:competence protein ComEA
MSLSWDPDDAPTDEAGWRTRLGAWFAPAPAELAGLAVLLLGALVLSGVLWTQAVSRPTASGPPGGDPVGEHGDHGGHDEHGAAAVDGHGPDRIGVAMDADGTAAGIAPGVDPAEGETNRDADDPGGDHGISDGAHGSGDGDGLGGDEGEHREASVTVVVHVTGAVRTTGVVSLPAGARIGDAVMAAGGTSPDALVERVNLARVVVDGEHVHVPSEGDDPATLPPIGGGPSGPGSGGGGLGGAGTDGGPGAQETAPIHLNQASAAELETLPGIGPARAEAIITHREQQGPFATPGDLRAVSGIGEATFQRLAPLITVE